MISKQTKIEKIKNDFFNLINNRKVLEEHIKKINTERKQMNEHHSKVLKILAKMIRELNKELTELKKDYKNHSHIYKPIKDWSNDDDLKGIKL